MLVSFKGLSYKNNTSLKGKETKSFYGIQFYLDVTNKDLFVLSFSKFPGFWLHHIHIECSFVQSVTFRRISGKVKLKSPTIITSLYHCLHLLSFNDMDWMNVYFVLFSLISLFVIKHMDFSLYIIFQLEQYICTHLCQTRDIVT